MAVEQNVGESPKPPTLTRVKKSLACADADYSDQLHQNPFSKTCDRVARVREYNIGSLKYPRDKDTIRLALVSLPEMDRQTCLALQGNIAQDRGAHICGLDSKACERIVYCFSEERAATALNLYREALDVAIGQQNADIVCFNELSFPAIESGPSRDAIHYIQRFAQAKGKLVIGGSAHDSRTLYNSGQLFYPTGDQPEASHIFYHKQVSAIATKEYVSIPCLRSTPLVRAFGLRIAILICLDMADYSTVASLFKHGIEADLLIVPSYSFWTEDPLEKIAIDVSAAMPGIVAIVNRYRPPPKTSALIYKFGRPNPERQIRQLPLASGSGVVSLYDFHLRDFLDDRGEKQALRDRRLQALFGYHPVSAR